MNIEGLQGEQYYTNGLNVWEFYQIFTFACPLRLYVHFAVQCPLNEIFKLIKIADLDFSCYFQILLHLVRYRKIVL